MGGQLPHLLPSPEDFFGKQSHCGTDRSPILGDDPPEQERFRGKYLVVKHFHFMLKFATVNVV